MSISIEEVNYIAKLSKLKFNEEEAKEFSNQFDDILKHFDSLNNEDLDDIAQKATEPGQSCFREDKVIKYSNEKNELFKNTKKLRDGYIEIPKVIE